MQMTLHKGRHSSRGWGLVESTEGPRPGELLPKTGGLSTNHMELLSVGCAYFGIYCHLMPYPLFIYFNKTLRRLYKNVAYNIDYTMS